MILVYMPFPSQTVHFLTKLRSRDFRLSENKISAFVELAEQPTAKIAQLSTDHVCILYFRSETYWAGAWCNLLYEESGNYYLSTFKNRPKTILVRERIRVY